MPTRCPATDTIQVDDTDLELQCVEWSEDPDGRHAGDHHVPLSPAMGGEHTWPNTNPLPDDAA
ncbi:hypothetical protein OG864_45555 [Streptomyces sp. NBC_00124]|uniref:hypothetical protein n=1 Tax=Streptomyces sp. NBC_00124 TaxID=2975662 RepID=UPI002258C95B|nr:hypothetical protein [Streptomyces sp. NBC_00124]MCX5365971.1 hypothetical protein [Streptomyces sp. NBC_00124]